MKKKGKNNINTLFLLNIMQIIGKKKGYTTSKRRVPQRKLKVININQ